MHSLVRSQFAWSTRLRNFTGTFLMSLALELPLELGKIESPNVDVILISQLYDIINKPTIFSILLFSVTIQLKFTLSLSFLYYSFLFGSSILKAYLTRD